VTETQVQFGAELSEARQAIAGARSVVVKIGSSALTNMKADLDTARLDRLADAVEARMRAGSDVVVVSSGAIGAGMAPLGLSARPRDLATKQAAASVGQLALAHAWGTSFARYGRTVGQVLLSADDFSRREHHRNAQRTLDRLRSLGAVAVVNENDTVATEEIRFGDNDRLAALVAHLVGADALVLLSDVEGLYDGDPRKGGATFIPEVRSSADLDGVIAGTGGALGTGGMASKLSAARVAAEFWVRHAADSRGAIHIDEGAVAAVAHRRHSLLAAGITAVRGRFHGGDVVDLIAPDNRLVARGVVEYDAAELTTMLGRSTAELPDTMQRPVIHADDMVKV
jgi:glutamate 5-kinase